MTALVLLASASLSFVAYGVTASLVPRLGQTFIEAGLKGKDMLKGDNRGGGGAGAVKKRAANGAATNGTSKELAVVVDRPAITGKDLPESTGLIAGAVYVLVLSLFAPVPYYDHFFGSSDLLPGSTAFSHQKVDRGAYFPHASLSTHLASLLSLLTAVFLGFLDDVFDIRWRFKLPIPIIASVPLLTAYAASNGGTDVVVPRILHLRSLFGVVSTGGILHLGPVYYLYMSLLSTFCTNGINILAGINGVEVGQALVIALSIAFNDLLFLSIDVSHLFPFANDRSIRVGWGLARGSPELEDRHLFSLYFILPLIGVMLALLKHNWYPARVFLGDTFCYFAGMTLSVVGILGHFSKTLLLFFLPQIFNFVYSCPQIFGIVPIPRHRLPARDPRRDVLVPSEVVFVEEPSRLCHIVVSSMEAVGLVQVKRDRQGRIKGCTNMTLLNLVLVWRGPMREDRLTLWIMALQVVGSGFAFGVRYGLAWWFYDSSRR